MKEQTLYIDILKKLSLAGIGFECEIIELFDFRELPKDKIGAIGLLETMQNDRHITYTAFPENIQGNDIISIKASISFLGLDWLINYDTATKTQKSFKNQNIYNIVSAGLIATSIIVSAYLNHSSLDKNELDNRISTLQLQVTQQKEQLNNLNDFIPTLKGQGKHSNNIKLTKKP